MRKIWLILSLFLIGFSSWFYLFRYNHDLKLYQQLPEINLPQVFSTDSPLEGEIPTAKTLSTDYHVFQSFNNCGPASLSMALKFYDIIVSQKELGDSLRPYQIASGDNDDKSVTLDELAEKSKSYGFTPYYRPNGNPEIVKRFIAIDIPVITRTWTKPDEDIGHYRVIKGYDDTRQVFIQDDSLQGKNLKFTYNDFNVIWGKFNYEYLVLVPKEKIKLAEEILGEDKDAKKAWTRASQNSTGLNKSAALYRIGDFKGSVAEFEKVENALPMRALWYQIEPILAYYELGDYDRVFEIANRILEGGNRAYSELYIIKGKIYKIQGNIEAAKSEFEKAVLYNKNLEEAQDLLKSVS